MGVLDEKRKEKRLFFTGTVFYSYSFLEAERLSCRSSEAVATNISPRGIGIYANSPLTKGQDLKLFSRQISDEPKSAFVRWCAKVSDSIFRVGIEFA